ncbi:MAG: FixH family protein [Deltaproteobacteria bacterium]|nr:FixH family protein [Deltaproteobacteria bacterium]
MRAPEALLLAVSLAAFACGGDTTPPPNGAGCVEDARADTYVAGLEKTTEGGHRVKMLEARPAPPDRGDNTWTFELADAAGAKVSTATVSVRPWMPDHGHGSTPAMFSGAPAGDGRYGVGPVNFFMPGLWELTVKVELQGGAIESAKFSFCVEG